MNQAKARILVVEDEEGILSLLEETLRIAGFDPITANSGAQALTLARKESIDLVLLDINLPLLDGFQVLTKLRQIHPSMPVIMLTARQDKRDVIEGFNLGADDYVVKPFSVEEVILRINALLRRSAPPGDKKLLTLGPISLSPTTHEVKFIDEAIALSRTEFNLLQLLMENPRRVLSKDSILRQVWGYDFLAATNVVDTYISYLRKKLHRDGYEGIRTVRGVGFQMRES
jgi:two-component system OmpR family response regulator